MLKELAKSMKNAGFFEILIGLAILLFIIGVSYMYSNSSKVKVDRGLTICVFGGGGCFLAVMFLEWLSSQ